MWKLHSNRPTPLPRASTLFARPSPRHSNCKQTKPTKDFIKRWMDKNKYQRDYPRRSTPFATAAFYGNGRLERKAKTNPKRTGRSTIGDCLLFCSMLFFSERRVSRASVRSDVVWIFERRREADNRSVHLNWLLMPTAIDVVSFAGRWLAPRSPDDVTVTASPWLVPCLSTTNQGPWFLSLSKKSLSAHGHWAEKVPNNVKSINELDRYQNRVHF